MNLFARRESWPPYRLVEEDIARAAERKLQKLERLYHVGQDNIWDGRQVLGELIRKHGRPTLDPARKDSALKLLSILLWGELAAWAISADLAERIDDVEAKMAATSQAHDEARHFYVLRDYLRELGEPVPRLGGIGRRLLLGILETDSLVHKLVGMQLLVESNALALFRGLAEAQVEPVLSELLPYYEKDEARHVGLGVMYLPQLLKRLDRRETVQVAVFQLRCVGMLMSGGMTMREDFRALGMNQRELASYTMRLQDQIVHDMLETSNGRRDGVRGLLNPADGFGPTVLDFIHPPDGIDARPGWHRAVLRAWQAGARVVDRALA
jgi:rubrerythrin